MAGEAGAPTGEVGTPTGEGGAPTGEVGSPTDEAGAPTGEMGAPTLAFSQLPLRFQPHWHSLKRVPCSQGLHVAGHSLNRPVRVSQKRPVHPASQKHCPEPVIPSSHCPCSEQSQAVRETRVSRVSDLQRCLLSPTACLWASSVCILYHRHCSSQFQK